MQEEAQKQPGQAPDGCPSARRAKRMKCEVGDHGDHLAGLQRSSLLLSGSFPESIFLPSLWNRHMFLYTLPNQFKMRKQVCPVPVWL